jgi:hypothetical protein
MLVPPADPLETHPGGIHRVKCSVIEHPVDHSNSLDGRTEQKVKEGSKMIPSKGEAVRPASMIANTEAHYRRAEPASGRAPIDVVGLRQVKEQLDRPIR